MGVLLVEDHEAMKDRQAPEQRAVEELGGPRSSFHWDPVRKARRRKMIQEMRGGH